MSFSEIVELDTSKVVINRAERQRRDINLDDILESVEKLGVINPIIVRQEGNEVILIAGERRLECCKKLAIKVPARFYTSQFPLDLELIELQENLMRRDLPWRDYANAVGKIHKLFLEKQANWTAAKTAKELGISEPTFSKINSVFEHINSPLLNSAETMTQAQGLVTRFLEKKSNILLSSIENLGTKILAPNIPDYLKPKPQSLNISLELESPPGASSSHSPVPGPSTSPAKSQPPILNENFFLWANAYQGPAFTLIHCDFPKTSYFQFLDCLLLNSTRLISHSSHLVIWFDLEFYQDIKLKLEDQGFSPSPNAFIWLNSGIRSNPVPHSEPRSVTSQALIFTKNSRPFVKAINAGYVAPAPTNAIALRQKPEPMLEYLLSAFVDNTTLLLDPSCGSGSAIRAGEKLGAKAALGLENNPIIFNSALDLTLRTRTLRSITTPR